MHSSVGMAKTSRLSTVMGLCVLVLAGVCATSRSARDAARMAWRDPRCLLPQERPADDDPILACADDADCEIVQLTTCDECNGGRELAVRRDAALEARDRYGRDCFEACTLVGCPPPRAACEDGRCMHASR